MTAAERIQTAQAAAIVGMSKRSVQGMAARGSIPGAMKPAGGRWTFDEARLHLWIKQREDEACRGTYTVEAPSGGDEYRLAGRSVDEVYKRLIKRKPKAATPFLDEMSHLQYCGQTRHSWHTAVARYATEALPGAVRPSTAKRYLVSLTSLDRESDGLYVDEITRRRVATFISSRKEGRATNATIRRDLTAGSRVVAACVAWGWVDANPFRDFDRSIIRERRDPIRPPDEADVDAVIAACPGNLARLVRVLDQTGMRQDEAVTLEWPNVDMKRGEITLHRTKTGRPRVIAMATPGGDAVGTFSGTVQHISAPTVFWHGDGQMYRQVASRFARTVRAVAAAKRAAGQPFTPFRCHDLRHAFAIRWLRNGGDIYALSRHLGYSSVKTTEIYLAYVRQGGRTEVTSKLA